MSKGGASPAGIRSLGGAQGAEEIGIVLEPGRHVFACMHGFEDGTNHLSRGMFRTFTVIASPRSVAAISEPRADATITMDDYSYKLTGKLSAGRRVIRLVNAGPQEHHMMLQKMLPGRTLADVDKWQAGGRKGERPVKPVFWGTTRQSRRERRCTLQSIWSQVVTSCFVASPTLSMGSRTSITECVARFRWRRSTGPRDEVS